MKQILKTFSIIFLLSIIMVISSCKKEIDGCTDSSAMNYSADAWTNDGSCIFAYDIAQGIWNISPDCEEYTMLVGVTRSFYRCMTCGTDLEQHVNGKITYMPHITKNTLQLLFSTLCINKSLYAFTESGMKGDP